MGLSSNGGEGGKEMKWKVSAKKKSREKYFQRSLPKHYKEKRTKYVPTSLDFYPNFPGNTVRVSVMSLFTKEPLYRVCIWGNDDYGFEYDSSDWGEVLGIYNDIHRVDSIDKRFSRV